MISRFKKFLSYGFDILLEERRSPINPELKLYLSKGQLKLVTSGAVYSYGERYTNFRDSFRLVDIQNRKPENVLILGLGMGSIMSILERNFNIQARYVGVEIDAIVRELFLKYKNEITLSPFELHTEDAGTFMKRQVKTFDLICVDLFCDRIVPERFESAEFVMQLKRALNPGGMALFNRLAVERDDIQRNNRFFETFQSIFPQSRIIKMPFNWMLVSS